MLTWPWAVEVAHKGSGRPEPVTVGHSRPELKVRPALFKSGRALNSGHSPRNSVRQDSLYPAWNNLLDHWRRKQPTYGHISSPDRTTWLQGGLSEWAGADLGP